MISKREAWKNVIEKEGKRWSQGSEEARRARIKNSDVVVSADHPALSAPFCASAWLGSAATQRQAGGLWATFRF